MAVDKDGWEGPDGSSDTTVDSDGWEGPAKKKKTLADMSTMEYAGRHLRAGIATGAKNVAHGVQLAAGGLASAGHKLVGGDGTFGDPLFEGMKSSDAYWDSHIQNEVGDVLVEWLSKPSARFLLWLAYPLRLSQPQVLAVSKVHPSSMRVVI
jgi:hypothetical protein